MKFCWTTLRVSDMEKSLHFYCDILGLPVNSRHSGPRSDIAMLGDANWPKVELLFLPDAPPADAGTAVSIGFFVDSLEATMEMLTNHGIKIARGPVSPDAHTSFFFVNDPDGVSVQFVKISK